MNPWWLRPPAEEGPSKKKKAPKPAQKTQEERQPDEPEKKAVSSQRPSGRGRGAKRRRSPAGKGQRKSAEKRRIAIFYDVGGSEAGLDIGSVVERLTARRRGIAKRAYADWQVHGDRQSDLRQAGLEIVEPPQGQAVSRGSADIRLAVDAVELGVSKEPCEAFAIVSDSGDFCPLVASLQQTGAEVIGVGSREAASSELVALCDEYLYLDELSPATVAPPVAEEIDTEKEPVFALLVATIELLEAQGGGTIWGSTLKQEMRRQQPGFDASGLGYATFTDLLEDADRHEVIHLERDDRSGSYYVAPLGRK